MMRERLVILEVVARPLYWIILAASVWVLFTGHNEPGGGFIGGLVAVSATVLWAVGVGLAAVSGLHSLWGGQAFLTHAWGSLPLGFTSIKVSTVMVFDLGVYLCVWGGLAGYSLGLLGLDEPAPISQDDGS
jgi:multicomponent Na+:H+ antiporter subunit B